MLLNYFQKAFTLLELLTTMVIAGILMAIAVPALSHWYQRNQAQVITQRVIQAIRFTQAQALAQQQELRLCGSSDGRECDNQWSKGQLVVAIKSQEPLRFFPPLPNAWRLLWRSTLSQNTTLEFLPSGYTDGQQGSFYICSKQSMRLVVNRVGRIRQELGGEQVAKYCGGL